MRWLKRSGFWRLFLNIGHKRLISLGGLKRSSILAVIFETPLLPISKSCSRLWFYTVVEKEQVLVVIFKIPYSQLKCHGSREIFLRLLKEWKR